MLRPPAVDDNRPHLQSGIRHGMPL
jgi:hypothetical protein